MYYDAYIKIYNDIPQIKQKDCSVEIYLTSTERKIDFSQKSDAHKFTKAAYELLTGKTLSARGAEKVSNAIGLVDTALGINTVDTVKNVLENGITGSVLGVFGKKAAHTTKNTNIVKEALDVTKSVLDSKHTGDSQHTAETGTQTDYNEQIETLKKLKDLLDAGVLTQEEFDAKKKEVLGL